MEIKKGYKQTEFGFIPNEWTTYRLHEIGVFKNGINKSKTDFGFGYPFVNLMDVFGPDKIDSNAEFGLINSNEAERKLYDLKQGDVLFIRSSVKPEGVGLTKIILEDLPNTVFSGFLIRFRDNQRLSLEYKKYCFSQNYFRKLLISNSTVSANTNINQEALKGLIIAIPNSIGEQSAIAAVLRETDNLITILEKLIVKKEEVKKGTMQVLLTGKKRLSGFTAKWKHEELKKVVEIISGGTPQTSITEYWNGDINWCTPTDITKFRGKYLKNTERTISQLGLQNSSSILLPKGTLLLCSRATIGEVKISANSICTNQGFKSLICSKEVYNEYLYYYIQIIKSTLIEKAIGSTFLEISKKDIGAIEILLPSIEEQEAIARVLMDMDVELEEMEKKLTKYKNIKNGMMQQLLTGKIRLV